MDFLYDKLFKFREASPATFISIIFCSTETGSSSNWSKCWKKNKSRRPKSGKTSWKTKNRKRNKHRNNTTKARRALKSCSWRSSNLSTTSNNCSESWRRGKARSNRSNNKSRKLNWKNKTRWNCSTTKKLITNERYPKIRRAMHLKRRSTNRK